MANAYFKLTFTMIVKEIGSVYTIEIVYCDYYLLDFFRIQGQRMTARIAYTEKTIAVSNPTYIIIIGHSTHKNRRENLLIFGQRNYGNARK